MTSAEPEPKPARRNLWLVVVVIGLLALTTWDVLRNSGGNSPAALRRAAFDGDEAKVRRILTAHPEWIDSASEINWQARLLGRLYESAGKKSPTSSHSDPEGQFLALEGKGATPLFHAVAHAQISAAQLLVQAGANVRVKSASGVPLVLLVAQMGNTNVLASFEAHGANLSDLEPRASTTILHYAIYAKRDEMLRFLISRGHSVNATNRFGYSPLHLAAMLGRLDFVQVLATNGSDLNLIDHRGNTALDYARKGSSPNGAAVANWLEAFAATNQPPAKPAP